MKFGQPLLTSELSGSVGGVVASSSRGGIGYFRVRRIPGNPRSPEQSRLRSILSSVAAAWLSITDAQRADWTAKATAGESGIDVFVNANVPLVQGGGTRVSAAPATLGGTWTPPTLADPETGNAPIVGGISATDHWNATAGGVIDIYVSTGMQTTSRLSQQFPFRFGGSVVRAGVAVTNAALEAAIGAAIGEVLTATTNLVPGNVFYIKLLVRSVTGQISLPTIYRLTTVSP